MAPALVEVIIAPVSPATVTSFVPSDDEAPDTYRSGPGAVGQMFNASVAAAIEDMRAKGIRFAGMIADSIFSSDGVYPGQPGFLAEAVATVRAAGGLYIADEVQPGFGTNT